MSLVMVWAVVQSIAGSRWANGLEILVPVALPALLTGAIFARLRQVPTWIAHILSAALGVTWIIARLDPLLSERLTTWHDQATELLIRTITLVRVLANGGRGEDIVLFVMALALMSWMLGYITAWYIFRRGWTWWAIFLNAVFILVNYAYVLPKPTTLFFIFLASALMLIAYQNIASRQEQWAALHIEYPDFLPIRFMIASAFFCGSIIIITSILPSEVSNEQAEETWETMKRPFVLAREYWEDAFSTINAPPGTTVSSFTIRSSTLGGARQLGNEVVMYVRSSSFEYWRAVAFDRYTSQGWQNTTAERARAALNLSTPEQARTPLEPDTPMPLDDIQARTLVTQTVDLALDRKDDFVTVGGQAVEVSLPTMVEHDYTVEQNRYVPNFDDTALIVAREPLRENRIYTVTALISTVDVQSLREASTNYPDWVRDRYLQLPQTITPRTLAKAREIVQQTGANTPYDQAIAIQDYLRTLTYNESISSPPAGVDPVDYFLFDLREGYCDYYASAMVIMLRYLGIPARWVQGYAGGTYDFEMDAYVVRENIAHSWPEVYFPDYGWQRFEPTPASYTSLPDRPERRDNGEGLAELDLSGDAFIPEEPEPDFLEQEDLSAVPAELPVPTAQQASQGFGERLMRRLMPLGIGISVVGIIGVALVMRRRTALRGLSPAAAAYVQLGWLTRWAGLGQRPHSTPYEYGQELEHSLPEQHVAIRHIVHTYVRERYRRAAEPHTHSLAAALKQLRRPLIKRIVARFSGWTYWKHRIGHDSKQRT